MRDDLTHALAAIGQAGLAVDQQLVAAEQRHAEQQSRDETALQRLRGCSRELWNAHKALQRAIRATEPASDAPAD